MKSPLLSPSMKSNTRVRFGSGSKWSVKSVVRLSGDVTHVSIGKSADERSG